MSTLHASPGAGKSPSSLRMRREAQHIPPLPVFTSFWDSVLVTVTLLGYFMDSTYQSTPLALADTCAITCLNLVQWNKDPFHFPSPSHSHQTYLRQTSLLCLSSGTPRSLRTVGSLRSTFVLWAGHRVLEEEDPGGHVSGLLGCFLPVYGLGLSTQGPDPYPIKLAGREATSTGPS
jgi:hypothetical protein